MMRRPFYWRQILAFGALMLSAWIALAQNAPSRMVAKQVAPDAYMVQGLAELGSSANQNFISNAGFVITPSGVVVVDALGSPELARRLLAEIRQLTPQPVKWVILTHYHADHIYGLQVFQEAGAKILAGNPLRQPVSRPTDGWARPACGYSSTRKRLTVSVSPSTAAAICCEASLKSFSVSAAAREPSVSVTSASVICWAPEAWAAMPWFT